MEIPVFELYVPENDNSEFEVDVISLVSKPAIQSNWMAFSEQPKILFSEINEDKRIIVGPAMIPDIRMYREDDKTKEKYYVYFSKETIQILAQRFFLKGYANNATVQHDGNRLNGVTYFMSWIKDSEKGMQGIEGDYPDGTWFVGAKVNDDATWNKIKKGEIKGFSVEGYFIHYDKNETEEVEFEEALKKISNSNVTAKELLTLIGEV